MSDAKQAFARAPQPALRTGDAFLPDDLREWVDERTLASLAVGVVADLTHGTIEPVGTGEMSPRTFLTILAYGYATGRYASEHLEHTAATDPMFRYLCGNQFVDWQMIRQFRRVYRSLIVRALVELFHVVWTWRVARLANSDSDIPSPSAARRLAVPGLDGAFQAAAESRLAQAIRGDSMAMDV